MTLTAVFEGLEDMMNFAKVMAGNLPRCNHRLYL